MPEEVGPTPVLESQTKPAWRQSWRTQVRRAGLFAIVLVAVLLGVILYHYLFPAPIPLSQADVDGRIVAAMASATPPPANSMLVYQTILPSLVFIQTQATNPDGEDGFGVGSGVVVNQNGDILTALHVVMKSSLPTEPRPRPKSSAPIPTMTSPSCTPANRRR